MYARPIDRIAIILALLLAAGCLPEPEETPTDTGTIAESDADTGTKSGVEWYESQPIDLTGMVRNTAGEPLEGATVELQRIDGAGATAATGPDGRFAFGGLTRRNGVLVVEAGGHRPARVPVWLRRSVDEPTVAVDSILLSPTAAADARLLFTGDVSLGRRFFDPEDGGPRDRVPEPHPDALIDTADPTPDTEGLLRYIKPRLTMADYTAINLETVVTDEPDTPFEAKRFIFFSLPGSLPAIEGAGVDYAGLGNNHLWDYKNEGVAETIASIEQTTDIAYSGAGMNATEAYAAHRTEVGGASFGLLSMCSIIGYSQPRTYAALADKPGIADLNDTDRVERAIQGELDAGHTPVAILHTGIEYVESPIPVTHDRFEMAVDAGAPLVIGHHPHVAQGFEWRDGSLIAHSLGNLVFDQQRLETLRGLLAQVEMKDGEVVRATGVPIYLEDTRPHEIAGRRADRLLRRLGAVSAPFDTVAFPYNGRLSIPKTESEYTVERRSVEVTAEAGPETDRPIIDLRNWADSAESLARIEVRGGGPTVALGRDIMGFGGFEDMDVDGDHGEASRWYFTGGSSYPCYDETHRGAMAMCSDRDGENESKSIMAFRNRIRVLGNPTDEPNKDLTLFGYTKKENAGRLRFEMRHRAPLGPKNFKTTFPYDAEPATHDWRPFARDLDMPPDDPQNPKSRRENARAVRFSIYHHPPPAGPGTARIDDLAVVTWTDRRPLSEGATELATPNPVEFLQLEGDADRYEVTLTFERHVPAGADRGE